MKIDRFDQINEKKKGKYKPVGEYIWKKYLANINIPGTLYFLEKIKEWESQIDSVSIQYGITFLYLSHVHFKKHLRSGDVDSLNGSDLKILLDISKEVDQFGEMTIKPGRSTGEFEIHMMFKDKDKLEKFMPEIELFKAAEKYNL